MAKVLSPEYVASAKRFVKSYNSFKKIADPIRSNIQKLYNTGDGDVADKLDAEFENVCKKIVSNVKDYEGNLNLIRGTVLYLDSPPTMDDFQGLFSDVVSLSDSDAVAKSKRNKLSAGLVSIAEKLDDWVENQSDDFLTKAQKMGEAAASKKKAVKDAKAELSKMSKSFRAAAQVISDYIEQDKTLSSFVKKKDGKFEKISDFIKKKYGKPLAYAMKYGTPGIDGNFVTEFMSACDDFITYLGDGEDDLEKVANFKKFVLNPLPALKSIANRINTFDERAAADLVKKAEAPPNAPLGSIAFAEEREDVPFEKDTKIETGLYDSLVQHIGDNIPLSDSDTDLIRSFIKKGLYDKIFVEPGVKQVYRGMTVPKAWLVKALKLGKKEAAELPDKGSEEKTFTLTPKRKNATSWSTSLESAEKFRWSGEGEYGIILYAMLDDNPGRFLDLRKGLYDVEGLGGYESEKEAVGMGKIKVYKVAWKSRQKYY